MSASAKPAANHSRRAKAEARPKAPPGTTWRGKWLHKDFELRGVRHRDSLRTNDVDEARRKIAEERRRLTSRAEPGSLRSWKACLVRWEAEMLRAKKEATVKRYRVSLRQLAEMFQEWTIDRIGPADITAYVDYRLTQEDPPCNATLCRDITALSNVLRAARRWGFREDNPAGTYDRLHLTEVREPWRPPTRAEIVAVVTWVAARSAPAAEVVRLLAETGMRMAEAVNLQDRDVDFETRQILLLHTKGNRARSIDWRTPSGDASLVLDAARARRGSLFRAERTGEAWTSFSSKFCGWMRDMHAANPGSHGSTCTFSVTPTRSAF